MSSPKRIEKHTKTVAKKHAHATKARAAEPEEIEAELVGGDGSGEEVAPAAALSPAEEVTASEALARIRARAMALRPDEILPYRYVPAVAIVHVRKLKVGLARFRDQMPEAMPRLDMTRFDGLEDTALALVAAANDADKVSSDGEFQRQLEQARAYRGRLLPVLHGLAVNGEVPMKVYTDIAAGRGIRDIAKDCVDLPAAFRKYAAQLAGKHPVRDEDLAASDAVGTWLLRNLGTKGVKQDKGPPSEVVDLRNRVATLLARDYDDATVIAHYFMRDGYLEVAPPLRSRFIPRRAPATPVEPVPPTSPTGTQPGTPTAAPTPAPAPVAPAPPPAVTTSANGSPAVSTPAA